MRVLNTKLYEEKILECNVRPGAKVKSALSFKPLYEAPERKTGPEPEHVPRTYRRMDIGLMLQAELERRFICLCEALYFDAIGNTYPDVATITEAVARFKEVFYIMEWCNVPPNFIYNAPAAYCNYFRVSEDEVRAAIWKNAEHLTDRDGLPTADKMNLGEYLRKLNHDL